MQTIEPETLFQLNRYTRRPVHVCKYAKYPAVNGLNIFLNFDKIYSNKCSSTNDFFTQIFCAKCPNLSTSFFILSYYTTWCQHRDSPFSGNRVTIGLQIGRLKRYPVAGSLLSCERSFELRTTIPMQSSVNKHNFLLRSSQPLEKADYVFTRNVTILI